MPHNLPLRVYNSTFLPYPESVREITISQHLCHIKGLVFHTSFTTASYTVCPR